MIEKKAGSDDEKIFNEALKRMLQTPPKPHNENATLPKKRQTVSQKKVRRRFPKT